MFFIVNLQFCDLAKRYLAPVKIQFPRKGKIVLFSTTKQGIDGYLISEGN